MIGSGATTNASPHIIGSGTTTNASPHICATTNASLHMIGSGFTTSASLHMIGSGVTGLRSAVCKVSGYRCVSDCRSRGRELDPGPVPYFRGD